MPTSLRIICIAILVCWARFARAGTEVQQDVRICVADSDGSVRAIDTKVTLDVSGGQPKSDAAQAAAGSGVHELAFTRLKWGEIPLENLTPPIAGLLSASIGQFLDGAFRNASPALVLNGVEVLRWKAWDRSRPCQPEPKPAVAPVTQQARICVIGGHDTDSKPALVMAVDLKLTVSPSDNPERAVAANAVQDAIGTGHYQGHYRWESAWLSKDGHIDVAELERSEIGKSVFLIVESFPLNDAKLKLHEGHITRVQKWEANRRCEPIRPTK